MNKYEKALEVLEDVINGASVYYFPYQIHKSFEDLKELIEIDKCKQHFGSYVTITNELWNAIYLKEKDRVMNEIIQNAIWNAIRSKETNIVPRLEFNENQQLLEVGIEFELYPRGERR